MNRIESLISSFFRKLNRKPDPKMISDLCADYANHVDEWLRTPALPFATAPLDFKSYLEQIAGVQLDESVTPPESVAVALEGTNKTVEVAVEKVEPTTKKSVEKNTKTTNKPQPPTPVAPTPTQTQTPTPVATTEPDPSEIVVFTLGQDHLNLFDDWSTRDMAAESHRPGDTVFKLETDVTTPKGVARVSLSYFKGMPSCFGGIKAIFADNTTLRTPPIRQRSLVGEYTLKADFGPLLIRVEA